MTVATTAMGLRSAVRLFAVAVLCTALAGAVCAQDKPGTHRWNNVPLADALYELADASGVSLVFAHRLVEGRTVSATYTEGEEPDAALAALLRGTGLRAERIRRGRYVVLAEPLNLLVEDDDPAAYTGTLEGQVVDAETGEPLWGAHAWLVDLDLGGVADFDGRFAVPYVPTGEYTVRFSHVGYRPVRVRLSVYPVSPQLPPTIRLQPELVVTADATVRATDEPPAEPGLTELDSRQAAALPVRLGEGDLGQALAWLPGVARDAGGGGLAVRGADPSLTRYLRDGVPFLEPWHAFGLFSALQPEAYRRVRFHRGSLPAELGGGLAGVVEVETKDGLVDAPSGVAALSPLSVRAVAEAPLSPGVGLLVAGRGSMLQGLFAPTLRREAAAVVLDPLGLRSADGQDVAHGFYDAEAKLTWEPRHGHRLALGGYLGADRLDARLPALVAADGPEALRVDDAWANSLLSAHYRFLGRRLFVSATGYASRYALREQTAAADVEVPFSRDYRVGFAEVGVRADVDYFLSLRHELRFGGHVAHQTLETELAETVEGAGSRAARADGSGVEASLYVQDTWQPAPRLEVQAGLRADGYSEGAYVFLSPRLHARYAVLPERLYLRGGLSRQVQALHRVRDRYAYTYDLAASRWLLPSEGVRPASSWQLGLGVEWAPTRDDAPVALAFSADAYGRLLDDVLEPIDPAGWTDLLMGPGVGEEDLLRFYRPSEGRAVGVELAARAERGPLVLGLSYALSHADVRVPDAGDGWRPSRYGRPHVLGLLAQYRSDRVTLAARLTAQSGLPTPHLDAGGAPVPGPMDRHAPEARLDLAVGYGFDLFGLHWDASAQALGLGGHATGAPPFADGTAAFLATDVRGLPFLPLLSLQATW